MRHYLQDSILELLTAVIFAAAVFAVTSAAHAAGPTETPLRKEEPVKAALRYEVKSGDSLGSIANAHNVSLTDLIDANEIENPDRVNSGVKLVIPKKTKKDVAKKQSVRIKVPRGVTLSKIAEVYGTSVRAIVKANKMKNPDKLRAGQRLLIPGASKVLELVPPPPCYMPAVEVYRVRTDKSKKLNLCYCNGKPNEKAVEELSHFAGPVKKEMPFPLHSRLIQVLQKVATQFPGKRIEIISGQRVRKTPGHESYHNKGQALDYRVAGVSNKTLVKYVRKLNNVGAGYYPNSVFIHMDVRDKSAYWIDYSRPGEKSIYGRANMTVAEIKAIRDKRRQETLDRVSEENSEENPVVAKALAAPKKDKGKSTEPNIDRIAEVVSNKVAPVGPRPDFDKIAEEIADSVVETPKKTAEPESPKKDTSTSEEAASTQPSA